MISVIICTLGSKSLNRAIASVVPSMDEGDELLIVCPEHVTVPKEASLIFSVRGLATQRNVGIQSASNDIVLFLDDDAYLQQGSLAKLREFYLSNEMAVGCELSVINEIKDKWAVSFFAILFGHTRNNGQGKFGKNGLPNFKDNNDSLARVECLRGYMMSYNLRNMKLIQYFDTKFDNFWWGDDFEYSFRASQLGAMYKLHDAFVYHEGNSSLNLSPDHVDEIIKNYKYISEKHRISKIVSFWTIFGFILFKYLLWVKKS